MIPGYPLESLQIEQESGKYISEMTSMQSRKSSGSGWSAESCVRLFEGFRPGRAAEPARRYL